MRRRKVEEKRRSCEQHVGFRKEEKEGKDDEEEEQKDNEAKPQIM